MRKELDLERRDLFDADGSAGAGSKRKQPGPQPGVAKAVALQQVRVKYLQAVAQTNADGVARIGTKRLSANMRIQPEAKAGLLELANIHHSKRPRRGPGALSPPPSLVLAKCLGVCARPGCCVCAGPGPGCPDDTRFVRQCVRRPRRPGLGGIAAFAGPVSMFSDDCIAVCRALRPPARASRVSTMLVLCCVVVC